MPEQNEDKGITLVIARSHKAAELLKNVKSIKDFTLRDVVPFNGALVIPAKQNPRRLEFMSRLQKGESFSKVVKTMTKDPFFLRMKIMINKMIRK